MTQVTWRAPDDVVARVRQQAAEHGRSLNDWLTTVLTAVADPASAGTEAAVLRERLARAGLLEHVEVHAVTRPDAELVRAARAAAGASGPMVSDIVLEQRG